MRPRWVLAVDMDQSRIRNSKPNSSDLTDSNVDHGIGRGVYYSDEVKPWLREVSWLGREVEWKIITGRLSEIYPKGSSSKDINSSNHPEPIGYLSKMVAELIWVDKWKISNPIATRSWHCDRAVEHRNRQVTEWVTSSDLEFWKAREGGHSGDSCGERRMVGGSENLISSIAESRKRPSSWLPQLRIWTLWRTAWPTFKSSSFTNQGI